MRILITTSLLLLTVGGLFCSAETVRHGEIDIHYTAFPSTIIAAEAAQAHDIVRSENKIIVNVSIKQRDEPAKVQLAGEVINLLEQVIKLNFTEVQEDSAIYYLATHISRPKDVLRFNLFVTPLDGKTFPITFMRRYD